MVNTTVNTAMKEEQVIRFGDVIKLHTKSSYAEGIGGHVGFLHQNDNQLFLVVPPIKDDSRKDFNDAEFIIWPVQSDNPPMKGVPLHYRQPFVLKTSDGKQRGFAGYSLNNKPKGSVSAVCLSPAEGKGEMYVMINKEGYTENQEVHDGDMNFELTVVNSNRNRKNHNKTLTHVYKAGTGTLGGFVCSSGKGETLTFKIEKLVGKRETHIIVKNPVARKSSLLHSVASSFEDMEKIAEVKEPEEVNSNQVNRPNEVHEHQDVAPTLSNNMPSTSAIASTTNADAVVATAVSDAATTIALHSSDKYEVTGADYGDQSVAIDWSPIDYSTSLVISESKGMDYMCSPETKNLSTHIDEIKGFEKCEEIVENTECKVQENTSNFDCDDSINDVKESRVSLSMSFTVTHCDETHDAIQSNTYNYNVDEDDENDQIQTQCVGKCAIM